jgi:hypothetical protein
MATIIALRVTLWHDTPPVCRATASPRAMGARSHTSSGSGKDRGLRRRGCGGIAECQVPPTAQRLRDDRVWPAAARIAERQVPPTAQRLRGHRATPGGSAPSPHCPRNLASAPNLAADRLAGEPLARPTVGAGTDWEQKSYVRASLATASPRGFGGPPAAPPSLAAAHVHPPRVRHRIAPNASRGTSRSLIDSPWTRGSVPSPWAMSGERSGQMSGLPSPPPA